MPLLPEDRVRDLHAAAVDAYLADQRQALFEGVNRAFAAAIPRSPSPIAQLLVDLSRLNELDALTDGSVPFERWLSNAVLLTQGLPQQSVFKAALQAVQAGGGVQSRAALPPPVWRPHFLDEAPFDFSRPEARELWQLLERNVDRPEDVRDALERAGVSRAKIRMDQAPHPLWHDALDAAARQGLARRLVRGLAEDPELGGIRKQLAGLLGDRPEGPVEPRARAPVSGQEKRLGAKATWVDIAFLERGREAARSVARVSRLAGGESAIGTGFFIAPGRLLTNHHVLFGEGGAPADFVELWIDYEEAADGSIAAPKKVLAKAPVIHGEAVHDWATVDVDDPVARAVPALRLGSKRPVCPGSFVSIIQHPAGLPKKLGIFRNEVQHVDDDVVQYLTDTEAGSSGSPVFNEHWEVVALHHRWTEAPSPDDPARILNQGIRIERVIEALRARKLLP